MTIGAPDVNRIFPVRIADILMALDAAGRFLCCLGFGLREQIDTREFRRDRIGVERIGGPIRLRPPGALSVMNGIDDEQREQ